RERARHVGPGRGGRGCRPGDPGRGEARRVGRGRGRREPRASGWGFAVTGPPPGIVVDRVDGSVVEVLRARVLRKGWDLDRLRYDEDADPRTATFAARVADDPDHGPIGTATVFPEPCRWAPDGDGAWRLRAMATEDGRQGQGIG